MDVSASFVLDVDVRRGRKIREQPPSTEEEHDFFCVDVDGDAEGIVEEHP